MPSIDINFAEYLVPLIIGVRTTETNIDIDRYAGVAFFIDTNKKICTCKHIIESLAENEVLLAKDLNTGVIGIIRQIEPDESFDFATGYFDEHSDTKLFARPIVDAPLATDVMALGFTNEGKKDNEVRINVRLFKGHIVRIAPEVSAPGSKSTLEISFPSHKGFSGAPLINASNFELVGMLFSNMESTIELYSYSEVVESNSKLTEKIHRVIELGLAHSVTDITSFLTDIAP